MGNLETFDSTQPLTVPQEVRRILRELLDVMVNGGPASGGGQPAAESDFCKQLELLGASREYIEAALAYTRDLGNRLWRKKWGV